MSDIQKDIEDFLTCGRVAVVVGLSTHEKDFSCAIVERLEADGRTVFGVNPKFEGEEADGHYDDLRSIPGEPVDAVFITTSPDRALDVVQECEELGIRRVWMHQFVGKGSTSVEAVAFCG